MALNELVGKRTGIEPLLSGATFSYGIPTPTWGWEQVAGGLAAVWARENTRAALFEVHPQNKELLDRIETSLFALCLDDSSPNTLDERFRDILHGDGKNRWFDKSFQFIVGRNGRFGVNGEHSGLDGYPVHRLIRFIYDQSESLSSAQKYAVGGTRGRS